MIILRQAALATFGVFLKKYGQRTSPFYYPMSDGISNYVNQDLTTITSRPGCTLFTHVCTSELQGQYDLQAGEVSESHR